MVNGKLPQLFHGAHLHVEQWIFLVYTQMLLTIDIGLMHKWKRYKTNFESLREFNSHNTFKKYECIYTLTGSQYHFMGCCIDIILGGLFLPLVWRGSFWYQFEGYFLTLITIASNQSIAAIFTITDWMYTLDTFDNYTQMPVAYATQPNALAWL